MRAKATNAVVEKLYAYRDQLTKREDGVLRELSRLWLGVEARIQDELQALTQEIARRREAGEVITPQIISSLSRYQHFAAQAKREIGRYDAAAEPIIAEAQRANLEMGIEAANAALDLSTDQAFTRLHVSAFEAMAGTASDGTPLNRLLRRDFPLAFEQMNEALVQGVTLGRGAKQVAADMVEASRIAFERSILIARTEMNRAYRFATTEQYRQSGVVIGFRRLVYKPTACFACLMMDGEYYPVEQELYDHPRGKCGLVCVTRGGVSAQWETGSEWFMKLPPEEQRRIMGPGRYELWQGGGSVSLRNMVQMRPNAQWGPAPGMRTIEAIQQDMTVLASWKPTAFKKGLDVVHFRSHNDNMKFESLEAYVQAATNFMSRTLNDGIDGFVDPKNGDIYKVDFDSGEFGVGRKNGIIKTYYSPYNHEKIVPDEMYAKYYWWRRLDERDKR